MTRRRTTEAERSPSSPPLPMPIQPSATDYFKRPIPARRDGLLRIRERIQRLWPAVKEDMAYGTPTYHLDGTPLFVLADQKHFLVFYVVPYDLLDAFKKDLVPLNHGKSCIRLREVDDDALSLLDRIIRFVGATHAESKVRLKPVLRRGRPKPAPDPIFTLDTRRAIVHSEARPAAIGRGEDA